MNGTVRLSVLLVMFSLFLAQIQSRGDTPDDWNDEGSRGSQGEDCEDREFNGGTKPLADPTISGDVARFVCHEGTHVIGKHRAYFNAECDDGTFVQVNHEKCSGVVEEEDILNIVENRQDFDQLLKSTMMAMDAPPPSSPRLQFRSQGGQGPPVKADPVTAVKHKNDVLPRFLMAMNDRFNRTSLTVPTDGIITTAQYIETDGATKVSVGASATISLPEKTKDEDGNVLIVVAHLYDDFEPDGIPSSAWPNPFSLLANDKSIKQLNTLIPDMERISATLNVELRQRIASKTSFDQVILKKYPCQRDIEIFIPFKSDSIYKKLKDNPEIRPICRYYDEDSHQYRSDVEFLRFTEKGVWCATSHLRNFFDVSWSHLVPPFTKLSGEDFTNLTFRNMTKHPVGVYVVGGFLSAFVVLFAWAYVHDTCVLKHKKQQDALESSNNFVLETVHDKSKGACTKLAWILRFRLSNEHKYASVFLRVRPSHFRTVERVVVLAVYLSSVLA
eukprot:277940_1